MSQIYVLFGVPFTGLKIWWRTKNDKYEVCPGDESALREDLRRRYNGGDNSSEVEMSLIRLEAAIWSLMANKQEEEILKLPAELKSCRQAPSNSGNSPKSERLASAQKTAKNLWAKRRGWEEKKKEESDHFISFLNQADSTAREKRQFSKEYNSKKNFSKEKDDNKQAIGLGGCLEEFNLLYNNVEASLEEFWTR